MRHFRRVWVRVVEGARVQRLDCRCGLRVGFGSDWPVVFGSWPAIIAFERFGILCGVRHAFEGCRGGVPVPF